jgi:hypothetical protein
MLGGSAGVRPQGTSRLETPSPASPRLDLRPQPQPGPLRAKVHDGAGHVRISALIGADGVALREAQEGGNALSVDKVFASDHRRHDLRSIQQLTPQALSGSIQQ